MREFAMRVVLILFWRFGQLWYGLTQRFHTRKKHPVPPIKSIGDLLQRLSFGRAYKPDPFKGKLDVMRHAGIVQKWIDEGKAVGDCDEHGCYEANTLTRAKDIAREVWLCTIQMISIKTGKVSGHVFVVFYPANDPANAASPEWMDYDWPRQCRDEYAVMQDVSRVYEARPIGMTMIRIESVREDDSLNFDYSSAKLILAKKR